MAGVRSTPNSRQILVLLFMIFFKRSVSNERNQGWFYDSDL